MNRRKYIEALMLKKGIRIEDIEKVTGLKRLSIRRRMEGVSQFQIEECVEMGKLFNESLDNLFNPSEEQIKKEIANRVASELGVITGRYPDK